MKRGLVMLGCPDVCMYNDEQEEKVVAEVSLPGIRKKDITLEVGEGGFCLKAKSDELAYDSCYRFDERVDTKKIHAKFDNGLLELTAPIDRRELHARRIRLS